MHSGRTESGIQALLYFTIFHRRESIPVARCSSLGNDLNLHRSLAANSSHLFSNRNPVSAQLILLLIHIHLYIPHHRRQTRMRLYCSRSRFSADKAAQLDTQEPAASSARFKK
jgi:hypothetical protein